jgi:3-hydroxyisobutyrate dehydrogenase-like beta-hydroxyacid dehydrogenase
MDVGFIGLGQMGSGMAARLLKAGHQLTVYNRSPDKAQSLAALGAKRALSVAEACRGQAVFTMLSDDEAVEAVVFGPGGVIASLPEGSLHISSSTISLTMCKRLSEAHAKATQRFVSAPVFGRPDAVVAGQLFVLAAGQMPAVQAATPLLDAIGQKTFVLGEEPEAANLTKLAGNFLIASVIEGLSEAVALTTKGGVDARRFLDVMTSSIFNAPVYKTYGSLIADQDFEPARFAAPLGFKDIRLALAAGESLQAPMPLASLIRDKFITLLSHGGDKLDWAALSRVAAEEAGLRRSA